MKAIVVSENIITLLSPNISPCIFITSLKFKGTLSWAQIQVCAFGRFRIPTVTQRKQPLNLFGSKHFLETKIVNFLTIIIFVQWRVILTFTSG